MTEGFNSITYHIARNGLLGYLKDLQESKKNQVNPVILSNKYLSSYKKPIQSQDQPCNKKLTQNAPNNLL